jgi:putative ABC transport system permease protein
MNAKASLFLVIRTIKRGNKSSLIMILFMMILIFINLIFLSSVFAGIIEGANKEAINNQYGNILIEPEIDEKYITNVKVIKKLDNFSDEISVSPRYVNNTVISFDQKKDGKNVESGKWPVESIDVYKEKSVTDIYKNMSVGEYLSPGDEGKIIIGREIAGGEGSNSTNNLGNIKVGQEVDVNFNNGPKRTYTVKGIFDTKNSSADSTAFVNQKEIESFLGVHGLASKILVRINDEVDEATYIERLRDLGFKNEKLSPWYELMGMTEDANKSFAMVSAILSVIGTIVAGITVFIIIFVSVVNKRKQIGILKAIGMKKSTIILSFIFQALFYAVIGIILGTLLSLLIIEPYFQAYPMDFPMGWVSLKISTQILLISSVSLIIASFIGGFVPAFKAAKETILEAIFG